MAWRWVTVAVGALLVSACGSARSTVQVGPGPIRLAGGCGSTTLQRGRPPPWTTSALSAGGGQRPAVPFALSAQGTALAVVFGYPLRAGHPADPANKILWIMRRPRDGSGLVIHARPLFARAPQITVTQPPDAAPGEIYPSYVDVPKAGCWRLSLRWAHHTDSIDLLYRPARSVT